MAKRRPSYNRPRGGAPLTTALADKSLPLSNGQAAPLLQPPPRRRPSYNRPRGQVFAIK